MKAVELTPTSWILYDDAEAQYGLLVKKLAKYFIYKTDETLEFSNQEKLFRSVGAIKFIERQSETSEKITVDGLPVDQDEIYNIDKGSFTKTESSQVRYAAGFYGVKYADQYVVVLCPKLTTLDSYPHVGPFKTEFTTKDEINVVRKREANE